MKRSLQETLVHYLKQRPYERVAKGYIADLMKQYAGVTAETVGRRLRILHQAGGMHPAAAPTHEHKRAIELLEGGSVEVEHGSKNHCYYFYVPPMTKRVRRIEIIDGVAHEIYETVNNE